MKRVHVMKLIDTAALSARYRAASIDIEKHRLLVTNFQQTEQEADLSEPANCNGFGRIRHFRRTTSTGWPSNPLPLDPACKALGLPRTEMIRAQAFQNAVCNWRCWYCFVPFDLLSANPKHSAWLSPGELVDLHLAQAEPPLVLDLTGGQPDLTPEWVPWVMTELMERSLEQKFYLWSDDNLSSDYYWQYLSEEQQELIASFRNYGRVCCFKGFDAASFSFNTQADPALFEQQFSLLARLLATGMDIYAYATFTTTSAAPPASEMKRFVDRLQTLDVNLPLRTVPLEIALFNPVAKRLNAAKQDAMKNQWRAIEAWLRELEERFSSEERQRNITEIPLRQHAIL